MTAEKRSKSLWGDGETKSFHQLNPDNVLESVEKLSLKPTGRCLPLNSMENRVYEIEIENQEKSSETQFVVAKFYRPGRWTQQQIQEEHDFLWDLEEHELPVITPLKFHGKTLFKTPQGNLLYTIFPKKGGRTRDELDDQRILRLGRFMGRLHSIGRSRSSYHRLDLSLETYGENNLSFLLNAELVPTHLRKNYENLSLQIFNLSKPLFAGIESQRIHGDCHWGNIIWEEDERPFFIDFDDMVKGPCVQDIWLTIPGRDHESQQKRELLLEGYQEFNTFNRRELKLIETLRSLRFIHFSAWIGKRWEDPSFKNAFPHYGNEYYWETQLCDLKEQLNLIEINSSQDYD